MNRNLTKVASVGLTERNGILLTTVNKFGEHHFVELTDNEAEELLYDLHSIVMTKRGQALPSGKLRRFLKRI